MGLNGLRAMIIYLKATPRLCQMLITYQIKGITERNRACDGKSGLGQN